MSKTLHSSQSISERKFAEKLTVLNERGVGILARIYNIKKVRQSHSAISLQLCVPATCLHVVWKEWCMSIL